MTHRPSSNHPPVVTASQIDDLRLAASKLKGSARRSFQAAMTLKYCAGNARQAEEIFGWGRATVTLGLHEARTGIICLGAQAAFSGNTLWEDRYPEAADLLWGLAESHAQQDPSFQSTLSFTRLTAAEARAQLQAYGIPKEQIPSPRCMANVLNRNGYRLRPVVKAKPQKNFPKRTPSSPISTPKTPKGARTPNA